MLARSLHRFAYKNAKTTPPSFEFLKDDANLWQRFPFWEIDVVDCSRKILQAPHFSDAGPEVEREND